MNSQPIAGAGSTAPPNEQPQGASSFRGRLVAAVNSNRSFCSRICNSMRGSNNTRLAERNVTQLDSQPRVIKFYHGTTDVARGSIKRNGFSIAHKSGGLSAGLPDGATYGMKEASQVNHHFTTNKDKAIHIAENLASANGERPANLKLELSEEEFTSFGFERDTFMSQDTETEFRTSRDIPSRFVQDASPLPPGPGAGAGAFNGFLAAAAPPPPYNELLDRPPPPPYNELLDRPPPPPYNELLDRPPPPPYESP